MGHLCRCDGSVVYSQLEDALLSGIRNNLEREDTVSLTSNESSDTNNVSGCG